MAKSSKKVIILWHNGGRLANQLWLFISVYAYCLEMGYNLENHCFFEYGQYFNIYPGNKLIELLFFKFFVWAKKILPNKFFANQHDYFFRWYYKIYVKLMIILHKDKIIFAPHDEAAKIHYLKPTFNSDDRLNEFENSNEKRIYFNGWLFRNPIGIEKYRNEIIKYFRPKDDITAKVDEFIRGLRKRYESVVGVHIRQGDYKKEFGGGQLFFNENEANIFLNQYVNRMQLHKNKICFILCSDGQLDIRQFSGLNVVKTDFGPTEDLYALSKTNAIIGSDSTFGVLASYYGNIPLLVFKKEGIDWDYYKDKKNYFENKYSSFYDHARPTPS